MSMNKIKGFVLSALLVGATFTPVSHAFAEEIAPGAVSGKSEQTAFEDCQRLILLGKEMRHHDLVNVGLIRAGEGTLVLDKANALWENLKTQHDKLEEMSTNRQTFCGSNLREATTKTVKGMFGGYPQYPNP